MKKIIVLTFLLVFSYSCSNTKDLSSCSHDEIVKVLSKQEIIEKDDISGGYGIGHNIIKLKIYPDLTFEYSFKEEYVVGKSNIIKAKGKVEFIGNPIRKGNQAEQKINFVGKTENRTNFNLNATVVQFGSIDNLRDEWFFSYDNYAISPNMKPSYKNYRLPSKHIYFY
ncbi:hypothetical protein [uncultured Algibacter sp.]|uniref:hypothetical protein n=1 Tax=uncultured Algibacter sp. TaxID=298659 RepID=UPI002621C85C|nr:hypothetical protein [uncultured Algibacter sp.]